MVTVDDVYNYMKSIAPEELAKKNDNVGFLVGAACTPVKKLLVALDVTSGVITEALDIGANLIVAHHPLFFSLSSVTDENVTGRKIVKMLSGGVSAICMHTNLDAARGGVNDALAVAVGIADSGKEVRPLSDFAPVSEGDNESYGKVGYLKTACSLPEYLKFLKTALDAGGLRYYDAGRDVYKVALAGGSGAADWLNAVKSGCDTFVTADIKYHLFLEALEMGINLIDGDHFCTENVVSRVLVEKLGAAFPDIDVALSKTHKQIIRFY